MSDIDPHLLRAFLAVADGGTVNGAAGSLNRTQAAVSMQIRRLEALLGTTLFQRSAKGLSLTDEGRVLVPYAREILLLNREAAERVRGMVMEGRVRFGVVEDFAATRLPDMLRSFRSRNPRVHVDIIVASNARLGSLFEAGELDIAICDSTCLPHRRPLHSWDDSLLWVGRSDLALDTSAPLPVILFDDGCPWREPAVAALCDGGTAWAMVCEASTLVAMTSAVRVGIGIGLMMRDTIPDDCRVMEHGEGMPNAIPISLGLYAGPPRSGTADHLAEFIARQMDRSTPSRP